MSTHDAHTQSPVPGAPGHAGGGHGAHAHHIAPWQILLGILILLFAMTGLTVYTALDVNLGAAGNTIVALAIAVFKSALVVGFFMHLHWDNKFNAVVLLFCLLAIGCFLTFTIIDISSRGVVDPTRAKMIVPLIVKDARDRAIADGTFDPAAHPSGHEGGHEGAAGEHTGTGSAPGIPTAAHETPAAAPGTPTGHEAKPAGTPPEPKKP